MLQNRVDNTIKNTLDPYGLETTKFNLYRVPILGLKQENDTTDKVYNNIKIKKVKSEIVDQIKEEVVLYINDKEKFKSNFEEEEKVLKIPEGFFGDICLTFYGNGFGVEFNGKAKRMLGYAGVKAETWYETICPEYKLEKIFDKEKAETKKLNRVCDAITETFETTAMKKIEKQIKEELTNKIYEEILKSER